LDHSRKNHNLELFARMGGPFERMFFELDIYGDDLDPEAITNLLGVEPDQSYKKGDERPRGSQYYKTGGWIIKSGEIKIGEDRAGEEKFEEWVSSLPIDSDVWAELRKKLTVRIRLIGYTDQWNADFTISPKAISELAKRGLPLMIDPYLSLDEPDA
jgi:hypothetical protein